MAVVNAVMFNNISGLLPTVELPTKALGDVLDHLESMEYDLNYVEESDHRISLTCDCEFLKTTLENRWGGERPQSLLLEELRKQGHGHTGVLIRRSMGYREDVVS